MIADDTLTAQCLQRLLEDEFPGVEIATSSQAVLDALGVSRPDVVLLDIRGAAFDGFEAMHRLRDVSPATKVLVVTRHDEPEYVAESLRAGASGYVLKSCTVSELVTAIRAVLNGHTFLAPSLDRRMGSPDGRPRPTSQRLTSRQREVLQLVAQGRTAKEIANSLGLSAKTAVFHKMAIMDKLGLRTIADLTRYALEHGMLPSTRSAEPVPVSDSIPLVSDSASA
ncbi:MAG TPA: response regulator transcription factor [Bryobacteraceae bacterium]|nr:response regulator transcription factor [Bryobacteraceae bacterium]